MKAENDTLRLRISRFLQWEKRKQREAALIEALFYVIVGALVAQLFLSFWRYAVWVVPLAVMAVLAPSLLMKRRWRERDAARALAALDRVLLLDARVTTAWELLGRRDTRAVALLVLKQAREKLKAVDPRALFPREWSWHSYAIAPLLALWLATFWLDVGFDYRRDAVVAPPTLSQRLREFAQRLQEKARSENLPRSLEAARDMEKLAKKSLESRTADERFKAELSGMAKRMAEERSAMAEAPFGATESRQQLEDLRAELEAARDLFKPGARGEETALGQAARDRLAGLTQLKRHMDHQNPGAERLQPGELKALLNNLEKQVSGELDRRSLLEAEQYLRQMAQRGDDDTGQSEARASGEEQTGEPKEGLREKNAGTEPGDKPGEDRGAPPSLPEFQGGARAQVKGLINEGERSGIVFKATPAPGKSKLSEDEVIASYRRQAEAELNTEKIPEELKDTIKNYFLSLDKTR